MSFCIGCGCSDFDPCPGGCKWIRNDPENDIGVCSECPGCLDRWDRNLRAFDPDAEAYVDFFKSQREENNNGE